MAVDISEWPYTEQVTATQYKPGTIMSTSCNNGYTDSHMYKLLSFCHHRSDLYWQKNNESNDVIHRRTKLSRTPTFVHGSWRVSLGAQMSHLSIVSDSNWSVIWCGASWGDTGRRWLRLQRQARLRPASGA